MDVPVRGDHAETRSPSPFISTRDASETLNSSIALVQTMLARIAALAGLAASASAFAPAALNAIPRGSGVGEFSMTSVESK